MIGAFVNNFKMFKKVKYKSTVVNDKQKGYLRYPDKEDIYKKQIEEKDIDPEDPAKMKTSNKKTGKRKGLEEDFSGDDLDVPGSELDDEMENIGSEDEENNYYSLGGDNNHDTREDEKD